MNIAGFEALKKDLASWAKRCGITDEQIKQATPRPNRRPVQGTSEELVRLVIDIRAKDKANRYGKE